MKNTALFWLYIFYYAFGYGQVYKGQMQPSRVPGAKPHYETEYSFDTIVDPNAWLNQKPGLHVSVASTDRLYFRREVPQLENETLSWEETGWKGDRLNVLILVWSPDTLNQVQFRVKDLVNSSGSILGKDNIRLNTVRYVLSNYPYAAKNVTCDASPYKNVYLMPDRFERYEGFDLPGRTVRPVWVSLDIPASAEAGFYNGTIEVSSGRSTSTVNLKIKVQNQVLPKPHEWKHRLDLWQNPVIIARHNHLEPWSEEHKVLLRQHLKLYADAGGKYITTYAVHSPWSDNSFRIEEAMINWIRVKNGSWKFDYSIFDQYVELAMKAGIDEAITIYTPVPNENRFRYLDESSGNFIYESWRPGSDEYRMYWNAFLTDLEAHLEKKGWFEKTYLGINETVFDQTLAAIRVIKAHSSKWRITYAGDWHKELDTLLNDYSFLYGKEPTPDQQRDRILRGSTSTYYVCCNPPVPNNFVFSPPIEGRWISWYSAAFGYNGFLRWAYDAWTEDPVRDARHDLWPAGDCFLIYPGGNSGIRFEKLREGIVDFEKIRILREKVAKSTDRNIRNLMQQFEQHLKTFIDEREFDEKTIAAAVNKGRRMIEVLSDKL